MGHQTLQQSHTMSDNPVSALLNKCIYKLTDVLYRGQVSTVRAETMKPAAMSTHQDDSIAVSTGKASLASIGTQVTAVAVDKAWGYQLQSVHLLDHPPTAACYAPAPVHSNATRNASFINDNSSLVWKGTSLNRARVKDRVNNRVRNINKLHLWLWWTLTVVAHGYGSQWLRQNRIWPNSDFCKSQLFWGTAAVRYFYILEALSVALPLMSKLCRNIIILK